MKAPFVVFEGADGSGKTTASKIFVQELANRKLSVFSTCEPTGYEVGKIIRRYLNGETHDPKEMLFLFVADRVRHNVLIEQTLNEKSVVVCDRYSLSTRIYQDGVVDEDMIRMLCNDRDLNLVPDLLVYVEASFDTICDRIKSRDSSNKDIFEKSKDLIKSTYLKYDTIIKHGWKSYGKKIEIINSDCSIENMTIQIKQAIDKNWNMFSEYVRS